MAVLRILINGKPYCESDDIRVVTMVAEAVRRREGERVSLHAAGSGESPIQCLAADLEVGDEIVVQVVEAAGATRQPLSCSFCGRDADEVSSLVRGLSASICDQCAGAFGAALLGVAEWPEGASVSEAPEASCGFCAARPGKVPGVIVGAEAAICPECLRACSDIMTAQLGPDAG